MIDWWDIELEGKDQEKNFPEAGEKDLTVNVSRKFLITINMVLMTLSAI